MTISIDQVSAILKENYEKAINGQPCKNLMFECADDIILESVIESQLQEHKINYTDNPYLWPQELSVLQPTGAFSDSQPRELVIDDNSLIELIREPNVLFYKRLNWPAAEDADFPVIRRILFQLINDAEFITNTNQHYSLKNRLFTIATTFPENSGNTLMPLGELEKLFDNKYEVSIDLQFVLRYIKDKISEDEAVCNMLNELIATGFNVKDLKIPYMHLYDSVMMTDGSKQSYLDAMLEDVKPQLSDEAELIQCEQIVQWLRTLI